MAQQSHLDSETQKYPVSKPYFVRKNLKIDSKSEKNSKSQSIKPIFLAIYTRWFIIVLFVFNSFYVLPVTANAGFISAITSFFSGSAKSTDVQMADSNSQNVPLLQSAVNFDLNAAVGGGDTSTTDDGEALVSESGPSGTLADISNTVNTGQISKYTVKKGDSIGSIAKMYGVTTNTILWANDISASSVKEGQVLIILPVSGTIHTVVKGDTIKSLAKKYKADAGEISQFNDLDSGSVLAIGDSIVIPDGEGGAVRVSGTTVKGNPYKGGSGPEYAGYYIRPVIGGVKTQGIHGYNGIDIGVRTGTTAYAAAAGQVMIAKNAGWNTGYGKYIVISHYNGTQTIYAHLSEVLVNPGQSVSQGEMIGLTGNTGKSTGPHLHFEVRGAKNPF